LWWCHGLMINVGRIIANTLPAYQIYFR
jgi:hypothetical protein